ncbi:MAG: PAS domain S-box protein [Verrucomicrobiota bacterium]|nr:PAS domain S-box protein [Verrucomicrobiota bacterium]
MIEKKKLSQTMRIDLIPDVPARPVPGKKKRYIVSSLAPGATVIRPRAPEETAKGTEYEELLQSLYDAALITDMAGKIVDVNFRAREFLLYNRHDLRGMAVFDVISGADESLIRTLAANLANERYTLIQAYCIRKDGSCFPSEIAVNRLRLADARLCFFIRDTTLRRQADEMLRTEHNAIQNSGDGIAIADTNNQLEYVNPAAARMWGYDETDELLALPVADLWADHEAAEAMMNAVTSDRQFWKGELMAKRKDGSLFDTQVSAALNRNSDGEPVGAIFSFVDVSDRKRAEEAEREAERRRVMLESLGAACHHLGQPATVLLANLGIMKRKLEGSSTDTTVKSLLDDSICAMETLGKILHKLNAVNEYKTTKYIEDTDGAAFSRILDI